MKKRVTGYYEGDVIAVGDDGPKPVLIYSHNPHMFFRGRRYMFTGTKSMKHYPNCFGTMPEDYQKITKIKYTNDGLKATNGIDLARFL